MLAESSDCAYLTKTVIILCHTRHKLWNTPVAPCWCLISTEKARMLQISLLWMFFNRIPISDRSVTCKILKAVTHVTFLCHTRHATFSAIASCAFKRSLVILAKRTYTRDSFVKKGASMIGTLISSVSNKCSKARKGWFKKCHTRHTTWSL